MIVCTMTDDQLISEMIDDFKVVVSISNDKDKKVANLTGNELYFPLDFIPLLRQSGKTTGLSYGKLLADQMLVTSH